MLGEASAEAAPLGLTHLHLHWTEDLFYRKLSVVLTTRMVTWPASSVEWGGHLNPFCSVPQKGGG